MVKNKHNKYIYTIKGNEIIKTDSSIIRQGYADIKKIAKEYNKLNRAKQSLLMVQTVEPEMVLIPAGEFEMGIEDFREYNKLSHIVYLDDYYIGKYEVTFNEYDSYCEETGEWRPSDEGWGRGKRPVINVSWKNALAYCKWLCKKTGMKYRLPTEAEWEKAARGGLSKKLYPWGNEIDRSKANYDINIGKTTKVGTYPANGYGLYDMAGNVWEWCKDWYDDYYYKTSPKCNPKGPSSSPGSFRVIRGGSWEKYFNYGTDICRCDFRCINLPEITCYNLGFRVARTP